MDALPDNFNAQDSVGTGYALSFSDFKIVLKDASPEDTVPLLLKEWFHISVQTTEEGVVRAFDEGHREIDLEVIYAKIQADPEMKFTLYQRAMEILR